MAEAFYVMLDEALAKSFKELTGMELDPLPLGTETYTYDLQSAVAVRLHPDSEEFQTIAKDFTKGAPHFEVHEVRRIENTESQAKYWSQYAYDAKHGIINEGILYHTYRGERAPIFSLGLDQRMGRIGMFGRGIYFSPTTLKTDQYSKIPATEMRYTLRCRVLLGRVCKFPQGQSMPSLMREPLGFDTVLGNVSGSDEYAVYNSNRVLIEYEVGYKHRVTVPRV